MMKILVSGKCSDLSSVQVRDDEGKIVSEKDGYVPYGLGVGGGDYIELKIDLETGKIEDFDPEKVKEALRDEDLLPEE
jgi:hypothetical protein